MSAVYRFRPGAVDAIARSRNIYNDEQLAAYLGVSKHNLEAVRYGAPVTAELAAYVCRLQGDPYYIGAYFDQLDPHEKQAA